MSDVAVPLIWLALVVSAVVWLTTPSEKNTESYKAEKKAAEQVSYRIWVEQHPGTSLTESEYIQLQKHNMLPR